MTTHTFAPLHTLTPDLAKRASYSVTEIARALDLDRRTVVRLIEAGRLVAYRPALRTYRIRRDDLVAYLDTLVVDPLA